MIALAASWWRVYNNTSRKYVNQIIDILVHSQVIYLSFGDCKVRGRHHSLHLFATYLSLECGLKAVGDKTIHHLPRTTKKRNYLLGSLWVELLCNVFKHSGNQMGHLNDLDWFRSVIIKLLPLHAD